MNEQWRLLNVQEKSDVGDDYYDGSNWLPVWRHDVLTPQHKPHRRKIESGWREIKDYKEITFPCNLGFWDDNGAFDSAFWRTGGRFMPSSYSYTHWHPLPPLPDRLSDEEKAWREYRGETANERDRAHFIAGFKAAKGAK